MKKFTQSKNLRFYLLDDPHAVALPLHISIMENIRIDLKHWRENPRNQKTRSINIFAIQHFIDESTAESPKLKLKRK